MPRTKKNEAIKDELNESTNEKKTTRKKTSTTTKASTKSIAKSATKSESKTTPKTKAKTKTATKSTTTHKTATPRKKASTATSASTKKTKTALKDSFKTKKKVDEKTVEQNEFFKDIPEYYDLPYRYSDTVVTVLAQNPNTLFVYWDVSDEDIESLKKQYGENFFEITKPVLVVHNLTDNYSFEVDVNDFANNWYINVQDSKCNYAVSLCRKPINSNRIKNNINQEFQNVVNISYSNTIEIPNDHILFFKNNDKIYFKNIKTNRIIETVISDGDYRNKAKTIYNNYNMNMSEDRFDFNNPSSQNPSSNFM